MFCSECIFKVSQPSSTVEYDERDSRGSVDSRESREERGGEKWMTDTPTHTILLRGLPAEVDEKDVSFKTHEWDSMR